MFHWMGYAVSLGTTCARPPARIIFNKQAVTRSWLLYPGQIPQFYKLPPFPWIVLLDQCIRDYGTEHFRVSMLNSLI